MAGDAFRLAHNASGYGALPKRLLRGIAKEPTIGSGESTPVRPSSPDHDQADCFHLRLDRPPKNRGKGWQFGTNPKQSDCLLGHRGTVGISGCHFCITITQSFRIELHDESRCGTVVSLNGQLANVVVQHDKRLLSFEPGVEIPWTIIINAPDSDGVAFTIEFPNHLTGSNQYRKNLKEFVEASTQAVPPIHGLDLDSHPSTVPISRPITSSWDKPAFVYQEVVGSGEFGTVHRVIDVREGYVYASKKFKPPPWTRNDSRRNWEYKKWFDGIRNEYTIMKQLLHRNILEVKYLLDEDPEPAMVMEYCPLGNLEDLQSVRPKQYISAFRQILDGLRYIHSNHVAHRDLKPANLLVVDRHPLHIKISDFGLSKADGVLRTACGTKLYAAPEVYSNDSAGYWPSVDMWSTGVIAMQFLIGLPEWINIIYLPSDKRWLEEWSTRLVKQIDDCDKRKDLIDLLKHIVRRNPKDRFSADQCLEMGGDNGLFKRLNDGRIVDADPPSDDKGRDVDTETKTEVATPYDTNTAPSDCSPGPPRPTKAMTGPIGWNFSSRRSPTWVTI